MALWLSENWGSVVVLGVLSLVIGVILFCHFRAKAQGKSTCSCGCEGCAMRGACHSASAPLSDNSTPDGAENNEKES